MTTYLIQNAALLGGDPVDLLLDDGVVSEVGTRDEQAGHRTAPWVVAVPVGTGAGVSSPASRW